MFPQPRAPRRGGNEGEAPAEPSDRTEAVEAVRERESQPNQKPLDPFQEDGMATTAPARKSKATSKQTKRGSAKAKPAGRNGRNHSGSQHMRALAKANEVRLARASLKRSIAAGDTTVAEVLDDHPLEAEGMTVAELLASQRRWGKTRSRKLLSRLDLTESKRIGTLTERQMKLLKAALTSPGA